METRQKYNVETKVIPDPPPQKKRNGLVVGGERMIGPSRENPEGAVRGNEWKETIK